MVIESVLSKQGDVLSQQHECSFYCNRGPPIASRLRGEQKLLRDVRLEPRLRQEWTERSSQTALAKPAQFARAHRSSTAKCLGVSFWMMSCRVDSAVATATSILHSACLFVYTDAIWERRQGQSIRTPTIASRLPCNVKLYKMIPHELQIHRYVCLHLIGLTPVKHVSSRPFAWE